MATQPDDKRVGGRVEGRNSAALIGRCTNPPTKVGHLNLHVGKFAKMWGPVHMPAPSSVPAHGLEDGIINLCHNVRKKRVGRITTKKGHTCILAEIDQLKVNEPICRCDNI